jgi:hypothetical protein
MGYYGYTSLVLYEGESVTITDLPEGCRYYITETANADYYLRSLTGTVGEIDSLFGSVYVQTAEIDVHNEVVYTNDYAPYSLRLGEEVSSSNPDSVNQEFTFTVYLYKHGSSANSALFDQDKVDIEIDTMGSDGAEAPNYGSTMTFDKVTDPDLAGISIPGVYNVATFKLKHGQSIIFKHLGENFGYYIVESPNIHYALDNLKFKQIHKSTVTQDSYTGYGFSEQYVYLDRCSLRASLNFVNAQEKLSITKQVVNSDTTRDFVFNIFLAQMSVDTGDFTPLSEGEYQLTYTGRTEDAPETVHVQTRSDISHDPLSYTNWYGVSSTSEWAVAQVRLAAGQTVTIEGLPEGTAYRIEEVPVENYTVTATAVNGSVDSSGNVYSPSYIYSDASAVITNTYTPPEGNDLTISKTVTGNMGDQNKSFSFQVSLTDQDGTPLSDLDIMVKLPDGTETILTTDSDGTLTVSLTHGQEVVLEDLPQGTQYTITEEEDTNYTTSFDVDGGSHDPAESQVQSGSMDDESDVAVSVTNDRDVAVPTGIQTEIKPFILTLIFALGFFLLWGRKRFQFKR